MLFHSHRARIRFAWKIWRVVLACFLTTPLLQNVYGDEGVVFSWDTNQNDGTVGYRLYYGYASRFTQKSGQPYPYYLDLLQLERCSTTPYNPSCEYLGRDDIDCTNLYQQRPHCTIKGLAGAQYFSLTAYNDLEESDFSIELTRIINDTMNPACPAVVPFISKLLL